MLCQLLKQEERIAKAKAFLIPRQMVYDAYRRVKAKDGAAGVDGVSIAEFEKQLEDNL